MPVKGKRILVTLSWDTYDTLAEFAKLTGQPVATVARGILEDATPALKALLVQLDRVRAGDLGGLADLTALLLEVLGDSVKQGAEVLRAAKREERDD